MKRIIVILSVLTVQSQIVYSQNSRENSIKSIDLRVSKSEVSMRNNEEGYFLKSQLNMPACYELKNITNKGTKDSTTRKSKSGYIHERYEQYYKGIKIEYSDIRVHYSPDSSVLINGIYIDVSYIDTSIIFSEATAIEKAKAYIGAEKYIWEDSTESN